MVAMVNQLIDFVNYLSRVMKKGRRSDP